jgi:zinc transport system permease protein
MLDALGQTFFVHALAAGSLVGLTCSYVGVYVLLRRMVFLGIALAQLASAAVGLALLVGWNPLVAALVASLGGAMAFSQLRWRAAAPVEAVLAAAYVLGAALGIVFVARNPVGEARALTALFGTILAVPGPELAALAAVAAVVTAVHLACRRHFVFVSFDHETAAAQGVRARLWDLLLHVTMGVVIAFAIRSAGVLVTFTLLVIPALGARLLASGVGALFATAVTLGTVSVPVGLAAALALDLPTGAAIALTCAGLLVLALAGQALGRRLLRPAAVAALAGTIAAVAGAAPAGGQTTADEIRALREAVSDLRRIVTEQQRLIEELRAGQPAVAPPSAAPPPAAASPSAAAPAAVPASPVPPEPPGAGVGARVSPPAGPARADTDQGPAPKLPPWIAWLPELRVEGNFIGNVTFGDRRKLERALGEDIEGEEFFVRRNRLNVREVELGLRSAIDPFARLEAIISAEQAFGDDFEVSLEEGVLTLTALPGRVEARLGLLRTAFGEYNDSDPEEFPEVDPPNVITNVFGRDGDGWIDTGLVVSRLFGVTDTFTIMPSVGVFNGDNEAAFHGGAAGVGRRPVWYGRIEAFWELGEVAGLEVGTGYASGWARDEDAGRWLRSRIFNAHVELDWRHPTLALYRGFNLLAEVYYTWRDSLEEEGDDEGARAARRLLGRYGVYLLGEAQLSREWSVGGRFDYSQLPTRREDGPRVQDETAGSFIVSYRPSRFLTLRAQYKHTERNFAPASDELFLQALFKLGYERPGPF